MAQMSLFSFILLHLISLARTDEAEAKADVTNPEVSTGELVTMLANLTSIASEQQKMTAKFHADVLRRLDEQTDMLTLLFKKRKDKSGKSKKPNNISTATPAIKLSPPASTWTYSNSSAWLSPLFPGCGREDQSPVELHTVDVALKEYKTPITFSHYDQVNKDTCKLVNNGNTATILMTRLHSPLPTLIGGSLNTTEYYFTEAVFHWGSDNTKGSEHSIRGTTYPLEMQLVHEALKQEGEKLAVTSFMFEVSEHDNPFLAALIKAMVDIKDAGSEIQLDSAEDANQDAFSMDLLIQDAISGPYFSYSGSLTYPPCTAVQHYMVFRVPLDISSNQLAQFRLLLQQDGSRMVDNFRPIQAMGKRILGFTM